MSRGIEPRYLIINKTKKPSNDHNELKEKNDFDLREKIFTLESKFIEIHSCLLLYFDEILKCKGISSLPRRLLMFLVPLYHCTSVLCLYGLVFVQ